MKTTLVCMSASLLLLAGTAPAALRVYDGFDYQPGFDTLNGQNGGSGWTGPWDGPAVYGVVEPGLSFVDLTVTGNCIVRWSWPDIQRTNSFALADGETAWLSALAQCVDGNTSGGAWLQLGEGLSIGHTYNPNWRLVDWNVWGDTGIPVVSGQTVLLVVRMTKDAGVDNDSAWLWVNPSLLTEPQTNAADQRHVSDLKDIDTSYVRVQESHFLQWDELRIGDTWQDVMPRTIYAGSPDIELYDGGTQLPDGGATDFGTLSGSMTAQKTITITNLGDAALFLTASNTPIIEIAGDGAGYFSVTVEPATNIPAGVATTFVLQFDPPDTGDGSAAPQLIILNNDPDEDPYTITLHGAWNNSFFAYEPFDYETNTALNSQNGGSGWNSAWNSSGYTVAPDSLPFDLLVVNGNHVERNGTDFATVRALAPAFGAPGQTVWISHVTAPLSNCYAFISDPTLNAYVSYSLQLRQGTQAKLNSGKRAGQVDHQMDSQGIYGSSTIAVTSTPAFIVHRLIYGTPTNEITMWVNPVPGDAEPGTPDQTITTTSNMQFNTVGLYATGAVGPTNMYGFYYHTWDELRVGLSWQQVAPFVPEPVLLLPLLLCSLKLKR